MIQHSFKMNEHEKFKGAETKAEPRQIWCDPFLLLTASPLNTFISVQTIPALMFFGVFTCSDHALPLPRIQTAVAQFTNTVNPVTKQ